MGEERDWTPERCPNIGPIGSRCSHYAGHKERLMFECDFRVIDPYSDTQWDLLEKSRQEAEELRQKLFDAHQQMDLNKGDEVDCLEENKKLKKILEETRVQLSRSSNTILVIARDLAEAKNTLSEVESHHKHYLSGVEASQAHYKDLLRAEAGEDIPQAIIRVMKERDEFRSEVLEVWRERAKEENPSGSLTVETPSGKYSCTYSYLCELLGAQENEFLPDAIKRVLKEKELLQKHVNSLLLEKDVEEKIKRDRQGRVNHLNQELANADKLAFEYNTILRFLDGDPVHSETLDRLAERFSVLLKDPAALEKEIPESPQQDPEGFVGYTLDSTPIKSLEDKLEDLKKRVEDLEETRAAFYHEGE